jgi:DNA-binding response OmpR family regulator
MTEESSPLVLIVDDDPDIRSIIVSAIQFLGFRTAEASDGRGGIEAFNQELPDVAILDVMMPDVNGIEVCRVIKSHPEGAFVPVLMVTARDGIKDKVSALDGGADDYVTKPFNYQELQARVKALHRVRQLNVRLREKNRQLAEMQQQLVAKERQLLAHELGGSAAHELGQPLAAVVLNVHLIDRLPKDDGRYVQALEAIRADLRRMTKMIEQLRTVDGNATTNYHDDARILSLKGAGESPPK